MVDILYTYIDIYLKREEKGESIKQIEENGNIWGKVPRNSLYDSCNFSVRLKLPIQNISKRKITFKK